MPGLRRIDGGLTPSRRDRRDPTRSTAPTTHQDDHANIIRVYIRHLDTGKYLVADGATVRCDADEPEARRGCGKPDSMKTWAAGTTAFFMLCRCRPRYLACDQRGASRLDRPDPDEAGRWIVWSGPQGVWLISDTYKDGYVRLDEQGQVRAVHFGRDARSYWDVQQVWRVKTSDDPVSNPEWRRQHVPGPD